MTTQSHSNYNDIPYKSISFPHCQPERLHALAKMKGLQPADVATAKVLEIGCSFGGNLLPFAIRHPNSTVIGIDLSETQIATGQQMMQEIGLDNVSLITADITAVRFDDIQFDYIICHGVYSWVPPFVQEAILKLIQTYLAPQGVAFVSYNVNPGWHIKGTLKELMNFGTDAAEHPYKRVDQSLELLDYTGKLLANRQSPYAGEFERIAKQLAESQKYYLAHEYFEDCNYPYWFGEFVGHCEQAGLAYLTDSSIPSIKALGTLGDAYAEIAQKMSDNVVKMEQYMDILINRTFRTSLITHPENVAGRTLTSYDTCTGLPNIYLRTGLEKIDVNGEPRWNIFGADFHYPDSDALKVISDKLNATREPVRAGEILDEAHARKVDIDTVTQVLIAIAHHEQCRISFTPDLLGEIGDKPQISEKYARLFEFIRQNPDITGYANIYAQALSISPFAIRLIPALDGSRTQAELVAHMRQFFASGDLVLNRDDKPVDYSEVQDSDIQALMDATLTHLYANGFFGVGLAEV